MARLSDSDARQKPLFVVAIALLGSECLFRRTPPDPLLPVPQQEPGALDPPRRRR
jgi:hypothetical protein